MTGYVLGAVAEVLAARQGELELPALGKVAGALWAVEWVSCLDISWKSSPLLPFLVFRSDLSSLSFQVNLGCISVGLPFPVKVLQLLTASDTFASVCTHFGLRNISQEKGQIRWIFLKEEVDFWSTLCLHCRKSVVRKHLPPFKPSG